MRLMAVSKGAGIISHTRVVVPLMSLLLALPFAGCTQEKTLDTSRYPQADQVFLVVEEDMTGNQADFVSNGQTQQQMFTTSPKKPIESVSHISQLKPGYKLLDYEKTLQRLGYKIEHIDSSPLEVVYDIKKENNRYIVTLKRFTEGGDENYIWDVSVQELRSIAQFRAEQSQKASKDASKDKAS